MRMSRKAGVLMAYVVCGALTVSGAGVATAAPAPSPVQPAPEVAAPEAAAPGEDNPLGSLSTVLGSLGDVLAPVTGLLDAVLGSPNRRLSDDQAGEYGDQIETVLERAQRYAEGESVEMPSVLVPLERPARSIARDSAGEQGEQSLDPGRQALVDAVVNAAPAGDVSALSTAISDLVNALLQDALVTDGTLPASSQPEQSSAVPPFTTGTTSESAESPESPDESPSGQLQLPDLTP